MYVCVYIFIHTHTYGYRSICLYMYIYIIYIYIHIYIYTHIIHTRSTKYGLELPLTVYRAVELPLTVVSQRCIGNPGAARSFCGSGLGSPVVIVYPDG